MESPLTRTLRLAVYWVTIAALLLSVSYTLIYEIRDAWHAEETRKAIKHAVGATLGLAFLVFLLLNPPES